MKTKEEYVEFVREWKITHEALVTLQLYVKKYLIKAVNKNKKYNLSDEDIKKCLAVLEPKYGQSKYSDFKVERLGEWKKRTWANSYKWDLRHKLHDLYVIRTFAKEQFKQSQLEVVEV